MTRIAALVVLAALSPASFAQNLTPTRLSAPNELHYGQRVPMTVSIRNVGTEASAECSSAIYLSRDELISTNDPLLASWTTRALPPNAEHTVIRHVNVPNDVHRGVGFLAAYADNERTLRETRENDNVRIQQVRCFGLSDVLERGIYLPNSIARGELVPIRTKVRNNGLPVAVAFRLELYLSSDPWFGSTDRRLGSTVISGMAHGQVVEPVIDVRMPNDMRLGTQFVLAVLDRQKVIPFEKDSNNIGNRAFYGYHAFAVKPIGSGCRGSNGVVTQAVGSGTPEVGRTVSYAVANAPRRSVTLLNLGWSSTRWNAFALPLALDVFGATSCDLLVSLDGVMFVVTTDDAGAGRLSMPLPNDRKLVGKRFFTQFLAIDAAANALGITTSGAICTEIGLPKA